MRDAERSRVCARETIKEALGGGEIQGMRWDEWGRGREGESESKALYLEI